MLFYLLKSNTFKHIFIIYRDEILDDEENFDYELYKKKCFIEINIYGKDLHAFIDLSIPNSIINSNSLKYIGITKIPIFHYTFQCNGGKLKQQTQLKLDFTIGTGKWSSSFEIGSDEIFFGADIIIGKNLINKLNFGICNFNDHYPLEKHNHGTVMVKGIYNYSLLYYYIPVNCG